MFVYSYTFVGFKLKNDISSSDRGSEQVNSLKLVAGYPIGTP